MSGFHGFAAFVVSAWLVASTNAIAADDHFQPRLKVIGGDVGSTSLEAHSGDIVYRVNITPVQLARVHSPLRGSIVYADREGELRIDPGTLLYRSDALMHRSHVVYCSQEPLVDLPGRACAVDEDNNGDFDRLWFLPGASTFDGGFAFQSPQSLAPGATYEEAEAVTPDGMALAIVYRPLGLRNYGPSSDFVVMALQDGQLRRLGFEFSSSESTRANPPQVEFIGVRLEVTTDASRTLHYRVLETPTAGSMVEQSFPMLVPVSPPRH